MGRIKTTPSKARITGGYGWRVSEASGFVRSVKDKWILDVRQGRVPFHESDYSQDTKSTWHPQDQRRFRHLSDPTPIPDAQDDGNPCMLSLQDLGITDEDRVAALWEDCPVEKPS